jgi:hypothetical protein
MTPPHEMCLLMKHFSVVEILLEEVLCEAYLFGDEMRIFQPNVL